MIVRVELLGPLRAWSGADELDLGSPQQRALFALLAAGEGAAFAIDEIAAALWPAAEPASATNVIQTYIKRLRKLLEPDRPPRQAPSVLVTVRGGYAIELDAVTLDVTELRERLRAVRAAQGGGDLDAALTASAAALELIGGQPLADVIGGGGITDERARIARECSRVIEVHADLLVETGTAAEGMGALEVVARHHPHDEAVQAAMVRTLGAAGRRSDAMDVYHRMRRHLGEVWGVDPDPVLQAAYEDLLDLPTSASAEQVDRPLAIPAQLPMAVGDFVGRSAEAARLADLLRPDPERGRRVAVAAVTGMGGIGKSSLAVDVAHRLADEFPEGQIYVDLGGGRGEPVTPGAVLMRVLLALGYDGAAIPIDVDARAATYRSALAGRRVLIVLDNALDEAQVQPLLPGTSSCAVLITGRGGFGRLCGPDVVELDVLSDEAALSLLGAVIGHDRVAAQASAAADLVARCDRIPLAVRLASARLVARPDMDLARFAEAVADERRRLDRLDPHLDSIRATFAISYESLPEDARSAFRRISVLPVVNVPAWVVAAVLGTDTAEAEARLDVAVDARLVTPAGTDGMGQVRYRIHDLVRLFGAERAEAEDGPEGISAAVGAAATAWLVAADRGERHLPRMTTPGRGAVEGHELPDSLVAAIDADPTAWFMVERVNLGGIIAAACEHHQAGTAWRLADACMGFYQTEALKHDWRVTNERCLRALDDDPLGQLVVSRNLAALTWTPDVDVDACVTHARRATALAGSTDDPRVAVDAEYLLGASLMNVGEVVEAREVMERVLARIGEVRYAEGEVAAHVVHGTILRFIGAREESARHYVKALEIEAGPGALRMRLDALRMLGHTRFDVERFDDAVALFEEGVAEAHAHGLPEDEMYMRAALGESLARMERPDAADHLQMALSLAQRLNSTSGRSWAERGLATVDLMAGRGAEARERLLAILERLKTPGVLPAGVWSTVRDLARAEHAVGNHAEARRLFRQTRDAYSELGNDVVADAVSAEMATLDD